MRSLHIDTGAEMRGGQRQVLLLMEGLRNAGHDSILLARESSPLWNAAKTAGFEVHDADTRVLWRESRRADIVHAHDARAHTMAAIACRRKFVVSRRVAFPVRRSVASIWKYQRPSRFLAVSHFVARELEAAGIRKEKIDVVYDGVGSVLAAEDWRSEYHAVAPASLDPEKGRDLVEQAAKIAGIRVTFSDTLNEDLRRASMFVYITRSEGFGSAVLLAMSMGVPVIASNVGGLAEIFADGVSGIFVKNEVEGIALAMRTVLEQPNLVLPIIRQARARIAECFTQEHLVHRTMKSYERALAG